MTATLSSLHLSAGTGFYLQSFGDTLTALVWILAIVIIVMARGRLGANAWSLGPLFLGLLGLVAMVVGEAGSRFTVTYSTSGVSDVAVPVPAAFENFGWANTTQVMMWFTVVLAILLGTFLFPRLAGGWGLMTGAVMVAVLDVIPPVGAAGQVQDSGGVGSAVKIGLQAAFLWTVVAVLLLAVGALIAFIAPDRKKAGATAA